MTCNVTVTDVNTLLALAVVIKYYPEPWYEFFWDAWLAVTIQLCILGREELNDQELFFCLWMNIKGVFYAESQVNPEDVKCVLMGQDPVSKNTPSMSLHALRNATGIAFHNIGNNNPSIEKMGTCYGLDFRGENPVQHCRNNGLLLVNMVRCIFHGSNSMDANICREAWTAYTLRLAHYFSRTCQKEVMVFCLSAAFTPKLPHKYLPMIIPNYNELHVSHPSRAVYDSAEAKRVRKKLKNYIPAQK